MYTNLITESCEQWNDKTTAYLMLLSSLWYFLIADVKGVIKFMVVVLLTIATTGTLQQQVMDPYLRRACRMLLQLLGMQPHGKANF